MRRPIEATEYFRSVTGYFLPFFFLGSFHGARRCLRRSGLVEEPLLPHAHQIAGQVV